MTVFKWIVGAGVFFLLFSCSTSRQRPCTEGGQDPHDTPTQFRGTKRCYQVKDNTGQFVNDGQYLEWFPSEKISVIGEYKMGKKTGRWYEYDESGKKISDKYFENGKEIPRP